MSSFLSRRLCVLKSYIPAISLRFKLKEKGFIDFSLLIVVWIFFFFVWSVSKGSLVYMNLCLVDLDQRFDFSSIHNIWILNLVDSLHFGLH